MLHLLILLHSLVAAPPEILAPQFERFSASSVIYSDHEATDRPPWWTGAANQIGPGLVGGLTGALLGGMVGAVVGMGVSGSSATHTHLHADEDPSMFPWPDRTGFVWGGLIGAGIGDALGEGVLVHMAADADRPSSGFAMPFLGGLAGFAAGAYGAYRLTDDDGGGWIAASGIGGSLLGAIVLDRALSRDARISAWMPRPGLDGVRLSLAF